MNILKNFEALFVMTLGLACAANYVLDSAKDTQAAAPVAVTATAPAAQPMSVVVVSAKRLSAAQKQQSLAEERKAQLASGATAASTI